MLCPSCKKPVTRSNDFCQYCGAYVPAKAAEYARREDVSGERSGGYAQMRSLSEKLQQYSAAAREEQKPSSGGTAAKPYVRNASQQYGAGNTSQRYTGGNAPQQYGTGSTSQRYGTENAPQRTQSAPQQRPIGSAAPYSRYGTGNAPQSTKSPTVSQNTQRIVFIAAVLLPFAFVIIVTLGIMFSESGNFPENGYSPEPEQACSEIYSSLPAVMYASDFSLSGTEAEQAGEPYVDSFVITLNTPISYGDSETLDALPEKTEGELTLISSDGLSEYYAPAYVKDGQIQVTGACIPFSENVSLVNISFSDGSTLFFDTTLDCNLFFFAPDGSVHSGNSAVSVQSVQ